jgi:hypothetical protein
MSRSFSLLVGCLLIAVAIAGCSGSAETSATDSAKSEPASHADHDHGATAKDGDHAAEIAAEMGKLSPQDRELAMKQAVCAVTGEPLGSMGAPIKIDVKGQSVFICCESCRDPLLADPDKHLAKLKK